MGDFVPPCESREMLVDIHVHEMDFVPGVTVSRAGRLLFASAMEDRLFKSVQGLTRFVGWNTHGIGTPLTKMLSSSLQRDSTNGYWTSLMPASC